MAKELLKYKWYIFIILALIIIEPSINSFLNFWLQKLFNSAAPGADKLYILRLLTAGFLFWMAKRLTTFFSSVLKARYICDAKQNIRHRMFQNLFIRDAGSISETVSSGECISWFTNDISVLEQRYFNQIISLIASIISVLILGCSFIALNVKLAIAIIAIGIIAMAVPGIFANSLKEKNLIYSDTISKFTQRVKEYLGAYPTIKNYAIEQKVIEKFDEKNQETEDTKFESDYVLSLANSIGSLLSWFMQFVSVGLGLMMVIKGEILIGTVIASQSFASDLAAPLQDIIININSIRSVRAIIAKLEKLSSNNEDQTGIPIGKKSLKEQVSQQGPEMKNSIVFQDLYLKRGDKIILDHFSFMFEGGKKYLIVGLNGSGKTSLFKVMKKWFHDCSGTIFLDGKDAATLSNEDISKLVSYINENVSLFSGSIKENISLFRDCTPYSFKKAVKGAQVNLDIEREIMDEGLDISSGEQRRIEIARSLLKSVPILVFDEVISTLDIETAYEIEKMALGFESKTIIFISHNFSGKLIKEYDDILVVERGKLLAHGNYEELLQNCEYFRKICEIKFG